MLRVTGLQDPLLDVPSASGMARIVNRVSMAWAPTVVRAAQAKASDPVSSAIAASGKIKPLTYGVQITFGQGSLRRGVPLKDVTRAYEFGTYQPEQEGTHRARSPKGKAFIRTRRVQRQVPRAKDSGRFLYPAVAACTPQLQSRLIRAILTEVVPRA